MTPKQRNSQKQKTINLHRSDMKFDNTNRAPFYGLLDFFHKVNTDKKKPYSQMHQQELELAVVDLTVELHKLQQAVAAAKLKYHARLKQFDKLVPKPPHINQYGEEMRANHPKYSPGLRLYSKKQYAAYKQAKVNAYNCKRRLATAVEWLCKED